MAPSWVPELENGRGPLYRRIAAALARDIHDGKLSAGERLPTHRSLAEALGITSNTVTKAYAEAERNGLVVSRAGRGSYVKGFPEQMADAGAHKGLAIDFATNSVSGEHFNPVFNRLLGALSRRESLHGLLDHHPHPGLEHHRAAGARWIGRRGIEAQSNRVVVCNGAQHGLLAGLMAVTRPRDIVLTEKLTYVGVRYIADILQVDLRGIETDDQGLIPEDVEAACQKEKVAAILVNPTNQNPTNAFMSLARRQELIEIARKAGALLVEDDIFGHVTNHDVPPIAALAPDRCIYVCGLSKSIATGLRVGYVLPPPALVSRVVDSLDTMHWSSPVLMGELATLLIEGEQADEIIAWHQSKALERNRMARLALKLDPERAMPSYHLWVPLPEPWRPAEFVAELKDHGVMAVPAEQFAVSRGPVPDAVRLAFGSIKTNEKLQDGLNLVAKCFQERPFRLHNVR